MLSYNKQSKYEFIYQRLLRICNSEFIEEVDYCVGVICGWTSAKLCVDYTKEETDYACKLAFDLAKQRKEYLKEKYNWNF